MTTDFRALCAELVNELHGYASANPHHDSDELVARARTLLAQPEGEGPTTAELMSLSAVCNSPSVFARAVLDRWGNPTPPPPADGEVAELVEGLKLISDGMSAMGHELDSWFVARAAELLQRFASPACLVVNPSPEAAATLLSAGPGRIELLPADMQVIEPAEHTVLAPVLKPVPVAERLPGPEDCLDEGWAWFFSPRVGWRQAVLPVSPAYTHWCPAHALPVPTSQGAGE